MFELFIRKGYSLYGVLRNRLEAEKLESELPKNEKIIFTELSSDESIKSIKASIRENPIDLLINNAGVGVSPHLIDKIGSEEILSLFNTY